MNIQSLTCKLHSSSSLELDLNYKVYCKECIDDSITNKHITKEEIYSNLTFDSNDNQRKNKEKEKEILKNIGLECIIHNKKCVFYCLSCKLYLCSSCICTEHKEHESGTVLQMITKAEEALKQKKNQLILLYNKGEDLRKEEEKTEKEEEKTEKERIEMINKGIFSVIKVIKERIVIINNEVDVLIEDFNRKYVNSKEVKNNEKASFLLYFFSNLKKELVEIDQTQLDSIKGRNLNINDYIFYQCLVIKENYSKIKERIDESKRLIESSSQLKNKENHENHEENNDETDEKPKKTILNKLLSISNNIKKLDDQLKKSITNVFPYSIYRLKRYNNYKLYNAKYIENSSLSFKVNKPISLIGLGISSLKQKKSSFEIKIHKESTVIYTYESQMSYNLNISYGLNCSSFIYFDRQVGLVEESLYSIQLKFKTQSKDEAYIDIWLGIGNGDGNENRKVLIENTSLVQFEFVKSSMSSDLDEENEGMFFDFLFSV